MTASSPDNAGARKNLRRSKDFKDLFTNLTHMHKLSVQMGEDAVCWLHELVERSPCALRCLLPF